MVQIRPKKGRQNYNKIRKKQMKNSRLWMIRRLVTCKSFRWWTMWCPSGRRGSSSGSPPGSCAVLRPELLAAAGTQPTGCCVSAAPPAPAPGRTGSSSGRSGRSRSWRTVTWFGLRSRCWCCCCDISRRCLWQGALLSCCCPVWGSTGSEIEPFYSYDRERMKSYDGFRTSSSWC